MQEKKDIDSQMTKSLIKKKVRLLNKLKKKLFEEEPEERFRYRSEFLRRNDEFLKLEEQVEKLVDDYLSNNKKRFKEGQITLAQLALEFFPQNLKKAFNVPGIVLRYCNGKGLKSQELKKKIIEHIAEYLVEQDQSAVEIVFNNGAVTIKSFFLDYEEIHIFDNAEKFDNKSLNDWKNERMANHPNKPYPGKENNLALDAVNKEDNTIMLKIHLDRKKEDIVEDFNFLLDLIEYEAELLDVGLATSKRPRWSIYDEYFKVYDLKKANPEMTWSEIAKKVIKGATYETLDRRGKKKNLVHQWAIDKVRHYWREANKMVEGGWRRI